jgi:uncharacterized RDD family membrane protein YckC
VSPNPVASRAEQLAQAIAASIVPLIVEAIDVDALVAEIDVDALVHRVDVDDIVQRVNVEQIVDRIDIQRIIQRADVNAIVKEVDVDELIARVDANALVARVDVDALIRRVDVEDIIQRVNVQQLIDRVDIQQIVERVDLDAILKHVDVNALMATVDLDAILRSVDVDAIMARVDVEKIIDRVDIQRVVERVDINAILRKVDVNAVVAQVDIDSLVENTELGSIIGKSASGVFTEILDLIRAQGVGLDDFAARWTNRILRRDVTTLPPGPRISPVEAAAPVEGAPPAQRGVAGTAPMSSGPRLDVPLDTAPSTQLTVERQGQYAGAVSRLAAFGLDAGAAWVLYLVGAGFVSLAVNLIAGGNFNLSDYAIVSSAALVLWAFFYFFNQWAVAGRTLGMALFGIRVVTRSGEPITARAAAIRTVTLPLSFLVFFLGLLGILIGRERRGWHDRFAGTAVVYAWDARAARLRWLADRDPTAVRTPVAGA